MRIVLAVLLVALVPDAARAALPARMPAHLALTQANLAAAELSEDRRPDAVSGSRVTLRYVGALWVVSAYLVGPTVSSLVAWVLARTDHDPWPLLATNWLAGSALPGEKPWTGEAALVLPPLGATLAANVLRNRRPVAPAPRPGFYRPDVDLERGEPRVPVHVTAAPLVSLLLP